MLALLGSALVKAARKILVKLIPDLVIFAIQIRNKRKLAEKLSHENRRKKKKKKRKNKDEVNNVLQSNNAPIVIISSYD